MNIITEQLPRHITVDNVNYPINSDFRVWLKFDKLINDKSIPLEDKFISIIKNCFDLSKSTKLPPSFDKTLLALCDYYTMNKDENNGSDGSKSNTQVFSFEYDSSYLYAAFLSQYNIDLIDIPYLHWYRFSALFKGLTENNNLIKIIGYRQVNLSEISDKSQKKFYKNMKEMYKLPDTRTEEEKENDFGTALSNLLKG